MTDTTHSMPAQCLRRLASALFGALLMAFAFTAGAQKASNHDDFDRKWQELIEAAQKEGTLSVAFGGAPSRMYRPPLDHFSKKYGIKIEVGAGSGRKNADRILAERQAGRYTVDIIHMGAGTTLGRLLPAGVLDPLASELIHPEVVDKSLWYQGRWWWADPEEKYYFLYAAWLQPSPVSVRYNTNQVTAADIEKIASVYDFLDDKFKGKIVGLPPTVDGSSGSYVIEYFHPEVGKKWLTKFITEMDVNFVTDFRQISDGLARGKYAMAINIGAAGRDIDKLRKQGLPVENFLKEVKEPGILTTSGVGMIGVANNRPHPNAAKLFVNWWLSREGQTIRQEMAEQTTDQTLRIDDIPPGNTDVAERRKPGVDYMFPLADPKVIAGRQEAEGWVAKLYQSSR